MVVKIVSLFLIAMAVLAMFGKLRIGWLKKPARQKKCPDCGAYIIGNGPCACQKH